MDALFGFLKGILESQPIMQAFIGGCTFLVIAYMVIRARGDREHLPQPASATIADVPQPFMQGPREVVDLMREKREFLRRMAEDTGKIRECVRISREEAKKQTELLERIAEDQRVEHRLNAERERRHP